MPDLKRRDLVSPELSYKIVGCAFDVHNSIGSGHPEKYYQKALAASLKKAGLVFEEQVYSPLKYKDVVIGKNFFDFLIDKKIIVEIKKGKHYAKKNIDQVMEYLKTSGLKLALLIHFGNESVGFQRVINFD